MTIEPMLERRPSASDRCARLMTEALRVGQAMGVVGDVDVDARIEYAARLDNVKTSMLQDRRARPIAGSRSDPRRRAASWRALRRRHADVREAYAALAALERQRR